MKRSKPRNKNCCLCCNAAAMEILASAVQSECDRVSEAASHEDWADCLSYTKDLVEILQVLANHAKGAKQR